jgi:hypothetical protein
MLDDCSRSVIVAALESDVLDTVPRLGHTPSGHMQGGAEVVRYSVSTASEPVEERLT